MEIILIKLDEMKIIYRQIFKRVSYTESFSQILSNEVWKSEEEDEIPRIDQTFIVEKIPRIDYLRKNNRRQEFGDGTSTKTWKLLGTTVNGRESRRRGTVNSENSIRSI